MQSSLEYLLSRSMLMKTFQILPRRVASVSLFGKSGLDYATQVQVLRSPDLIEPVVARLQQDLPRIDYDS